LTEFDDVIRWPLFSIASGPPNPKPTTERGSLDLLLLLKIKIQSTGKYEVGTNERNLSLNFSNVVNLSIVKIVTECWLSQNICLLTFDLHYIKLTWLFKVKKTEIWCRTS